ncbi:hypothetical protein ACJJTC_008572 [Scirpophaga incertulas]
MGEPGERAALFTGPPPTNINNDALLPNGNRGELHPELPEPVTDKDDPAIPYNHKWSFFLVMAGITTTLGSSVPVGFNIGVINTPAELIKGFCNESVIAHYGVILDGQHLEVLWAAVVSTFIVGGCTGSLLGAVLADWLGRKKATIATSGLWIAGALMFLFCRSANSVEMLIFGRLLVGLSGGLTTSIVPMYLTELSPTQLTGTMGVACPMGVNVGVLVGQVMGLNFLLGGVNDWPYLLSVYALLVIICLPMLWILPESPKYLYVVRRDRESALKELSRLRGVSLSVLGDEVECLRAEAGSDEEQAYGLIAVLKERRFLIPLLLVCSMQAGQQTSGINAVFYYSQSIFRQAGLSVAGAQYATIGCGFINVCTAVLMLRLLPRCGRRPLFLGSVLAAAVILAALAAALRFMDAVPWMPFVSMVAVLLYVLVYGFGLGPIPYFIASEMFSVRSRGAGMAWGSLSNWAGNVAVGMAFPSARAALGAYCFLVFAALTAALYLFHRKYLPETLGRTPAQVTELCARSLRNAHAHV